VSTDDRHYAPACINKYDDAGLHYQLHCPACGGTNTHQREVLVRNRHEDGPGTEIEVRPDTAIKRDLSANSPVWAGRRHEVVIVFECEACPARSELLIYQHKGDTFLRVRMTGTTAVAR
jgi:hypothetical protein